ncbi:MAG: c-type cytochrome [Gemmataceae bacterium]|nr:c-type cytochrome [Gemmataceae bacterium]
MKLRLSILVAVFALPFAILQTYTTAQNQPLKKEVIPHAQAKLPGPALSPQEALKKFEVPPGFRIELVAAEPDIVNPVAMAFDERGRIWITESIEYPKKAAGPGRDRVKVLESTKGDGKFDKVTTVIEGLNIPSGIAIGHGGVWLCNAPDILFYPFEDFAAPKLGKPQVVVTGFGRFDTHELPNSLTWGPDGWLYGLNGVFNRSVVKQDGKTFDFTCALFKIHPKTKKFELFCEGTSNPWGLAFNDNGDAFVSACVIDHFWHLTETGYYHRQGGPYPPYTWKIGSIVKHKHQKAAYCGLCWFDSDAYPPEYREKMYMGNIHGGAINVDQLAKDGSTYFASPALSAKPQAAIKGVGEGSNFLLANDAWFMPVAQKVGPDGCIYILDWYDRYHCYQDANRDPAGIDRLKGRLYRVVYKDYKSAGTFDLSKERSDKLIERLKSPNGYFRDFSQHVLSERMSKADGQQDLADAILGTADLALSGEHIGRKPRLHAMWSMIGGGDLAHVDLKQLLHHQDPTFRAWGIRSAVNRQNLTPAIREKIIVMAKEASPDVQLQVAIAARKLKGVDPLPLLLDVLAHCGDDKLIPHIVWQNLHPLLEKDGERFLTLAAKVDLAKAPGVAKVLPHAIDRILGNASGDPAAVIGFIEKLHKDEKKDSTTRLVMAALAAKVQSGEIFGTQMSILANRLAPILDKCLNDNGRALQLDAAILDVSMKGKKSLERVRVATYSDNSESDSLRALDALLFSGHDPRPTVHLIFDDPSPRFRSLRGNAIQRLSKLSVPWVPETVLTRYEKFTPDEQAKAIELLTQRPTWAKALFNEIAAKNISKDVININQARRLLSTKDKDLAQLIEKHWGIPRDTRNPERERIVTQMKELFAKTPGDPKAGQPIFKKLCAQCHKLHGEGAEVGPDITSNGRSDFDQLLSNIFDPSLVIGSGYQAVTVITKKGLTISGLVVEDNLQRVVLKVQGGELKTFARADVEEQFTSKLSMMPEDLEKQLRPQEIIDLLSYLSLDRPPEDEKARKIPGTPR